MTDAPEQAVLAAEDVWLRAVLARDTQAAEAILHPDYRLIVGIEEQPLRVHTRDQWLQMLPHYLISDQRITDRQVRVYGEVAVVTLLWTQTAHVPGDRDITGHFLLTDIWQKTAAGWQVAERHSSRQEKGS